MPRSSVSDPDNARWVVLAAASVIMCLVMGQLVNGLSVYFVPLEVTEGWSRAEIALINTTGLVGLAIGSMIMGFAAERFGSRAIAVTGVCATGLAVMAASRATDLWQLYTLFFLAGMFGGGAISAPLMALVGSWFVRGAGLAIGIASAAQALGQGGVPFSGAYLIDTLGWRNALMAQGAITLAVLLPACLLIRDAPVSSARATLSDKSPSGLPNSIITAWLAAAVVFCCVCMSVPLMHLVPLIQGCGLPSAEASSVLLTMLLVAIAGRVAFGRLADWIGAVPSYLIASAWQTALVFGFTLIGRLEYFFVFAVIYGFGYAGVMTSLLVTARNLAAPARRASTMGIVMAFGYFGHGIGGWQGGLFFDLTGSYQQTFANAALAGVINLAIVGTLWLALNNRRAKPAAV